jgi:hypothetical protein
MYSTYQKKYANLKYLYNQLKGGYLNVSQESDHLQILKNEITDIKTIPLKSVYNFTSSVYFFTDEEGCANLYADDTNQNSDLNDFMTFANTKSSGMVGGNECKLVGDEGLVSLGDMVDHNKFSIGIQKNLLNLKNKYPERVVLIAGNRDLNKIRMADECTIICSDNITDIFGKEPADNFVDLVKQIVNGWGSEYKFLLTGSEVENRVNNYVHCHAKASDATLDTNHPENRIKYLYTKTMGAPKEYTEWLRLQELGLGIKGNRFDDTDNPQISKAIALCILNMVMGNIYVGQAKEKLQKIKISEHLTLDHINGLYVKYILMSNIIAKLIIGNKNYLVSHHGIPSAQGAGKSENEFKVYNQKFTNMFNTESFIDGNKHALNATQPEFKEADLEQIMDDYQTMISYLHPVFTIKNNTLDEYQNIGRLELSKTLSLISGACSNMTEFSPVIGNPGREGNKSFISETPNLFLGKELKGGVIDVTEPKYFDFAKQSPDADSKNHIEAIIYGHIPQGFVPSIFGSKTNTKFICLDVSKANIGLGADDYSFAIYKASAVGEDKLFGRFKISINSGLPKDIAKSGIPANTLINNEDLYGSYNYHMNVNDYWSEPIRTVNVVYPGVDSEKSYAFAYKGVVNKNSDVFKLYAVNVGFTKYALLTKV